MKAAGRGQRTGNGANAIRAVAVCCFVVLTRPSAAD